MLFQLKAIQFAMRSLSFVAPKLAGFWASRVFLTPQKHKRPGWESELLVTAARTDIFEGCRFWMWPKAESAGGKVKPLIVLVHGWSGRGSQFGRWIAPLVAAGFRVLIFDGPAHGDSPGRRANAKMFAEFLHRLQEREGPFYALVGHSFGGSSSVVAVARSIGVKKLIAIAMPADLKRMFQHFGKFIGLNARGQLAFENKIAKEVGINIEDASPVLLAPRMTTPFLMLHDPHDREVSFQGSQKLQERWSGAKLVPVEKAGHYRILKAPHAIDEAIRFLSEP